MAVYKELDKGTFIRKNEEAQARKTGGGQWDSWKPEASKHGSPPAKNVIRIMPPHENMDDVFVEVKMHFLPSTEIDSKTGRPIPIGINCLAQFGEDCKACNMVDRLYKDARAQDDADATKKMKDQAYDRSAKIRIFGSVVDINHPDKGVQKYAFGPEVEKKLRACFFDDDGEFRNITHPKNGRDVIMLVTKKKDGDFNDYVQVKPKDAASALADSDWLDKITDLSEQKKKPSREDMENACNGIRPTDQKKDGKGATTASKPAEKPVAEKPTAKKPAEVPGKKPKRQPVEETTEETASDDPYAMAREAIAESGVEFVAIEITPDETEKTKKPACYTKETDVADEACQGCRVLLPCLTAKLIAEAA